MVEEHVSDTQIDQEQETAEQTSSDVGNAAKSDLADSSQENDAAADVEPNESGRDEGEDDVGPTDTEAPPLQDAEDAPGAGSKLDASNEELAAEVSDPELSAAVTEPADADANETADLEAGDAAPVAADMQTQDSEAAAPENEATEKVSSHEETTAADEDDANEEDVEKDGEESAVDDGKQWYVVKVQSGREESIKENIERRVKIEGLEEFFGEILIPVEKETVNVKGKRQVRERKLYPGYIMARVEYNDRILYLFRETSGVGDFVGGGISQQPQPMNEDEVRRMLGAKPPDRPKAGKVTEEAPYSEGDRVRVKDGVFSGMEGEVKEVLPAKDQIRIELFVLGRPVSVELEYWQVEPV